MPLMIRGMGGALLFNNQPAMLHLLAKHACLVLE